jgi:dTDP-4-dehydrorhamnose reductase
MTLPVGPVLITGAHGQVGTELTRANWPRGLTPVAFSRAELDLGDADAIADAVAQGYRGVPYVAAINAAAYTAVDRAEHDQVAAWRVNALAVAALAAACADLAIPIVQVSTDYVFSGQRAGPWKIDDIAAPANVYGASKLGGELAVCSSGARPALIRTARVVSAHGHNFVKTMLRLAHERGHLAVVADQHGCPTAAADLAAAVIEVTARLAADPFQRSGTWHFSNAGATTWAAFAEAIVHQAAIRGGPTATVERVASTHYPTVAARPANSVLDTREITADFGITPRPWHEALSEILDELIGERC